MMIMVMKSVVVVDRRRLRLREISCQLLLLALVALNPLAGPKQPVVAGDDSFPDIFQHMMGRDRFRFQYEMNTIAPGKSFSMKSALVEESYSFGLQSGRMLVDYGNAGSSSNQQPQSPSPFYTGFYWSIGDNFTKCHWLRPFTCVGSYAANGPAWNGMLVSIMPRQLELLLNYHSPASAGRPIAHSLQGLSALFANVIEHHASSLKRIDHHQDNEDGNNDDDDEGGNRVVWRLLTNTSNLLVEFSFIKPSEEDELSFEDLVGLQISVSSGQSVSVFAQITVLKADYDFADMNLQLPLGYSCSGLMMTLPSGIEANFKPAQDSRVKYTLEVSVTYGLTRDDHWGADQQGSEARANNSTASPPSDSSLDYLTNSWGLLEPLDSMMWPRTESRRLELVYDRVENSIAVVSQLGKSYGSKKESSISGNSLTIWDFNTKRKHVVRQKMGTCERPVRFESDLFGGGGSSGSSGTKLNPWSNSLPSKATETPLPQTTTTQPGEQVEIQLSERVTLKLNENGLKYLTFSREQLEYPGYLVRVDQRKGTQQGHYELTYEMPAYLEIRLASGNGGMDGDNHQHQTDQQEPLSYYSSRLVVRLSYSSIEKKWTPLSSTVLLFNEVRTKLLLQIDLTLLHKEPFRPWLRSHHLLDLSPCHMGPRQSARLLLDYPLTARATTEIYKMDGTSEVRELIRASLANYLSSAYSVPLIRIPSIEVRILDDMLTAELHLLDRADPLSESDQLVALTADSGDGDEDDERKSQRQYMELLRQATKSVLLASVESCAHYCQQYLCQTYIYCKFFSSCYIFSPSAALPPSNSTTSVPRLGSIRSDNLECAAYQVSPTRQQDQLNSSAKINWSLGEILESLSLLPELAQDSKSLGTPKQLESVDMPTDTGDSLLRRPSVALEILVPLNGADGADGRQSWKERSLRLRPSSVSYRYDNLQEDLLDSAAPASFSGGFGDQGILSSNFRVAMSGFGFVEKLGAESGSFESSETNCKHNSHSITDHLRFEDLDGTHAGYLILDAGGHTLELEDCARMCLSDTSCVSFSHCPTETSLSSFCTLSRYNQTGLNQLMSESRQGTPLTVGDITSGAIHLAIEENAHCTIMLRTYVDQFERLEVKQLVEADTYGSDQMIGGFAASIAEECASACYLNRAHWLTARQITTESLPSNCLSYDFCESRPPPTSAATAEDSRSSSSSSAACILFSRHLVSASAHRNHVRGDHQDDMTRPLPDGQQHSNNTSSLLDTLQGLGLAREGGALCWHYIRNFLTDFHKISHRRLPSDMRALSISNHFEAGNDYAFNEPGQSAAAAQNPKHDDLGDSSGSASVAPESPIDEGGGGAGLVSDDISLARCARLCEEDPDCGAFEFCLAHHVEAPGGLWLACSLGTDSTLEMLLAAQSIGGSKHKGGQRPRRRYTDAMLSLRTSATCSVYVYKSLSVVLGLRRKNLARIERELVDEAAAEDAAAMEEKRNRHKDSILRLLRLDLVVWFAFFLVGFVVRDLNWSQYTFRPLVSQEPTAVEQLDVRPRPTAAPCEQAGASFRLKPLHKTSAMTPPPMATATTAPATTTTTILGSGE